jgi:hypothetical protein
MRALAVPIAVVAAASVIGAVVDSRYWFGFGDNLVLVVVLFLACVLAVVNTWEFWASPPWQSAAAGGAPTDTRRADGRRIDASVSLVALGGRRRRSWAEEHARPGRT